MLSERPLPPAFAAPPEPVVATEAEPRPEVLLCFMPWGAFRRPSIPVALLSGICSQLGVPSRTIYTNFDMAARIGFGRANAFADARPLYGLSEHVFACDLFGPEALRSDEFIGEYAARDDVREHVPPEFWARFRDEVIPEFLDQVVERILALGPQVVGFSATWNQVMSSLAVARRLKQRCPDLVTIVGGACFHHPMGQEYHRALPEVIDHVFLGEADDSFREYVRRWKGGEPTQGIDGTTWLDEQGQVQWSMPTPVRELDRLPTPNYDDYFRESQRIWKSTGLRIVADSLPYESSRGCWWGRKNHCVFCGIDNENLQFRTRSVPRIIEDVDELLARYRANGLLATDLIIAWQTLEPLLEHIRDMGVDLQLFYEVRAQLKKSQIKLLRDAGANNVQPGIESFSSRVLEIMSKGTTVLTNLQFLRWSREYHVHASYNFLMGFPHEKAEWYDQIIEFLPKVAHLQPPDHQPYMIELHRFSPLYERREEFGFGALLPRRDYLHSFPQGLLDPAKIAYFFYEKGAPERGHYADYMLRFRDAVGRWRERSASADPPFCYYSLGPDFVKIHDGRGDHCQTFVLGDEHRSVLLLCDRIQNRRALASRLAGRYEPAVVERTVEHLIEHDLLFEEGGRVLALPISTQPRVTEHLDQLVLPHEVPLPASATPSGLVSLRRSVVAHRES